ncbi:MAG: mono/diheme cytochrome c family protein [Cyclobacteriaceae bacterium]|jgi:mono/diheme cytochrome c family protein
MVMWLEDENNRRRLRRRLAPAALLALCVMTAGCEGDSSPAVAIQDDAAALKRGKLLYTGSCGGYCHSGSAGSSGAPNLMDCTWLHGGTDQEVFNTISGGIKGTRMIGFGGKLPEGDADIWKLVAYLKSQRQCPAG